MIFLAVTPLTRDRIVTRGVLLFSFVSRVIVLDHEGSSERIDITYNDGNGVRDEITKSVLFPTSRVRHCIVSTDTDYQTKRDDH